MTWLAALGMGLLGSFGHCLGMCGPLAATVSLASQSRGPRSLVVALSYNAGRITTYAAIGFSMGLTGSFVNTAARLAGWQDAVSVVAGLAMVLFGAGALGLVGARAVEQRIAARVFGAARAVLAGGGPERAYPLGLLVGFLPCGLSYSAFLAAAATGHPASGLALTLAFGIGTAPALLLAGTAASFVGPRLRGAFQRVGAALVVLVGAAFVLRGLGAHAPL